MRLKQHPIDSPGVPTELVDPPWDKALRETDLFSKIQTHQTVTVLMPGFQPPETRRIERPPQEVYVELQEASVWDYARHWLYKLKYNSKHRIPACCTKPGTKASDIKKGTKVLGELLWSALELCKECHFYRSSHSQKYDHAAEWFVGVADDLRKLCLGIERGTNKMQKVSALRQYSQAIRENINPFGEDSFPHLHRLLAVALVLSMHAKYPDFTKNYLNRRARFKKAESKGFIPALSAWASVIQMNEAFKIVDADQFGMSYSRGQGRGKIHVSPQKLKKRIAKISTK